MKAAPKSQTRGKRKAVPQELDDSGSDEDSLDEDAPLPGELDEADSDEADNIEFADEESQELAEDTSSDTEAAVSEQEAGEGVAEAGDSDDEEGGLQEQQLDRRREPRGALPDENAEDGPGEHEGVSDVDLSTRRIAMQSSALAALPDLVTVQFTCLHSQEDAPHLSIKGL